MSKKKTVRKNALKRNMAKRSAKKPSSHTSSPHDRALRQHLLYLLNESGAHLTFDAVMRDWPVQLAGAKVANFPHTAWMLLEHLRIAQWDVLEFSRNSKHVSPAWPEGYWPSSEAPPSEQAWKASIAAFKKDLLAMGKMVADPKVDLFVKLPWGDGQTVLREALLLADHNAHHLGQLVMLRKSIGI
jgi:hypothetical protein